MTLCALKLNDVGLGNYSRLRFEGQWKNYIEPEHKDLQEQNWILSHVISWYIMLNYHVRNTVRTRFWTAGVAFQLRKAKQQQRKPGEKGKRTFEHRIAAWFSDPFFWLLNHTLIWYAVIWCYMKLYCVWYMVKYWDWGEQPLDKAVFVAGLPCWGAPFHFHEKSLGYVTCDICGWVDDPWSSPVFAHQQVCWTATYPWRILQRNASQL